MSLIRRRAASRPRSAASVELMLGSMVVLLQSPPVTALWNVSILRSAPHG